MELFVALGRSLENAKQGIVVKVAITNYFINRPVLPVIVLAEGNNM